MNQYITGTFIKKLREEKSLTQTQLADTIGVSAKAVSKWETGRGYPDISLIKPLGEALGVSVLELFSGESVVNTNRSGNMRKVLFHVCPICGNILYSTGEALISCCGITLPPLEAEEPDAAHALTVEQVEDEYFVGVSHPMDKTHFISFLAAVRDESIELKKLYPEGEGAARFKISRTKFVYYYCNRHGLFKVKV